MRKRERTNPFLALLIVLVVCAPDAPAEWELIADKEQTGHIYRLESDGRRLYATSKEYGVSKSLNNGYTWRRTPLKHSGELAISDDAVYVGTWRHGLFRSDDHANTWTAKNNGMPAYKVTERTPSETYPDIWDIHITNSGTVIVARYQLGTYISNNRGETWHDVSDKWYCHHDKLGALEVASSLVSMTEFDGYLWVAQNQGANLFRSPDNGKTWEWIPNGIPGVLFEYGDPNDWAVLDDRLYIAGDRDGKGIGRWNEAGLIWDNLSDGLPRQPISSLAVYRRRLFAGVTKHGVFMFNQRSETWSYAGLFGLTPTALVSHQSALYAGTYEGIYRGSIPIIQRYGKLAVTWGAVKTE